MSSIAHAVLLFALVIVLAGAPVAAALLGAAAVLWELFLFVRAGLRQ